MIDELPEVRIPLHCVVEWIATESGTREADYPLIERRRTERDVPEGDCAGLQFDARTVAAFASAYASLLAAIRDGRLPVYGLRRGDAANALEPVAAIEFSNHVLNAFDDEASYDVLADAARYLDFDFDGYGIIRAGDRIAWSGLVALSRADVLKLWPAPAIAAKRGRKAAFDWIAIERKVVELMDHHGEFSPDDPEWNAQARLETAIIEWCEIQFGITPATATLRPKLAKALKKWRKNKMIGK